MGVAKGEHKYFLPWRTRHKEFNPYQKIDGLNHVKFALNKNTLENIPFNHKKKKTGNKGAMKKAFRRALGI